jgi:hypothetical protein
MDKRQFDFSIFSDRSSYRDMYRWRQCHLIHGTLGDEGEYP